MSSDSGGDWGGYDCSFREDDDANGPTRKYDNGWCFPGRTLVLTPIGEKPINTLKQGHYILSVARNHFHARKIIKVVTRASGEVFKVQLTDSSNVLYSTKYHSFLTPQGWKRLSQLGPHDLIYQALEKKYLPIKEIAPYGVEPVFNLITEVEHNFVADGCLAHNFSYFRALRMAWYRTVHAPLLSGDARVVSMPPLK
jgi:hypothetical protein